MGLDMEFKAGAKTAVLPALLVVALGLAPHFQASPLAQAATPAFKADDYRKALWMTTRFYGGQRSGKGVNWLIANYAFNKGYVKDADGTYDLTGGWHDCGDYPMFGQTGFYSAYVLIRGYLAHPTGYDDLYDGLNYADYIAKGAWNYGDGKPNGIPDLLEEVKYATDFFIKAARDEATFYFQKGTGGTGTFGAHAHWVTSGYYSEKYPATGGGESDRSRPMYKNPKDASMASFCAATLAAMARAYRKFNPTYADLCIKHARYAYAYAKANLGSSVGTSDGNFYPANARTQDDFVSAATELFMATGEESFKTDAMAALGDVKWHNYIFCYNNNDDIAFANVGEYFGDMTQLDRLDANGQFLKAYSASVTADGVTTKGDNWGRMRFPANAAFIASVYSKAKKTEAYDPFIYKQIDFILGNNPAKQSYITGFCSGCTSQPKYPHHRNVFLAEQPQGEIPIPLRNAQHGSLIGGNLNSTLVAAQDKRDDYQTMEVCVDYQAGLVGALGYIMSKLAPVDTTRFGSASVLNPRQRAGLRFEKGGLNLQVLRTGSVLPYVPAAEKMNEPAADVLGRRIQMKVLSR
jgi:endoglucanase